MKAKTEIKWLCLILAVILCCSIVQNVVMTNGGKTRVEDVGWITDDGAYMSARLYLPKIVDAANPAPAIVAGHGWNNTLEVQEVNCIELSRRGYIVLATDAYGHGNSTQAVGLMTNDDMADGVQNNMVNLDGEGDAAVQDGGVYSALQYLGTLPFVDQDSIGLVGHSMGGYTIQMAALRALINSQNDPSVVVPNAIFVMCEGADADYAGLPLNIATLTPEFDEFGTGHWNVSQPSLANTSAKLKNYFGFEETAPDINYGQFYSYGEQGTLSREDAVTAAGQGKLRVSYLLAGRTHPGAHNSAAAAEYIIDFFNITLKGGTADAISPENQTWLVKNIAGLISLIMFFLLMLPVASILLNTPYFASLIKKPYEGVILNGKKSTLSYVAVLILGMLPSFLLFYPLMGNPIGVKFMNFITTVPFNVSKTFPMQIMNGLSLYNVAMGVIALLIFILSNKFIYKKEWSAFGVAGKIGSVGKALLLAVIVFLSSYMTLALANYFFQVDFRFFTLSIKTISPLRWNLLLRYVLFFGVFFVINTFTLNAGVTISGQKEWVNCLLCVLSNIGGLLVLHIVAYGGFFATGFLGMSSYCSYGGSSAMAAILVWGLLFVLPLAAIISRILYKKTGNIWVSGLINTLAVVFFAISNTAISNAIFY